MRATLSIAAILGLLATFWCAAGFFFAPAQAAETRAELSVFLNRALTVDVPEIHSSRLKQQGRNFGIACLLMGTSTALMLVALKKSHREKSHDLPA
jgi:hypothetical protein